MIIIVSIIFCGINTLANNHLFNSKDVDYDNSNTHIESTNVGDAIDELFDAANNFTTYDTRLHGIETKVGTGSLNTTAQNLIGGVNELNSNIVTKAMIKKFTITGTTDSQGLLSLSTIPSPNVPFFVGSGTGDIATFFNGSSYNFHPYVRFTNYDGSPKANKQYTITVLCVSGTFYN